MGFLSDRLYPRLPVPIQNVGISLFGYYWHQRRFGGRYDLFLKEFKERENYSVAQWTDYQTEQLRKLLIHAFSKVPYYQTVFRDMGFSLSDLQKFTIHDLPKIPPLEKNILREEGARDLLSAKREQGGSYYSSSGSTGTPTRILFSALMHQRYAAAHEARCRNWAGVNRFDPRGMIGGRRVVKEGAAKPPFYRYNFIEKQAYFSAYHIAPENATDYLKGIEQHALEYMTGYAGSNYFLARFFLELNLQPPSMKAVITSSEKLEPHMRETFRKVYGCKSFDGWSGVEACGMVTENEHNQLLISPDVGIIELVKPDGSYCKPGETGEVYCTGFLNFDQPLIRYKIGDLFKLAENQVTICGRSFPVIEEIVGRMEDTVVGKDGREMVRFHGIFIDLPNLIEAQIIQWELNHFEIKVITNGKWTEEESTKIKKRMISQLGVVKVDIQIVSTIPRNQNGKFQAVISHVKRNRANV